MSSRAQRRATKLREQAHKAVSKGKYDKALEAYSELEVLDEDRGDWSRRVGEMHRHLGNSNDAVSAWERAINRYAAAGFLLKAVAVCQMVLRLDPERVELQDRLLELNAARGIFPAPVTDSVAETGERRRTLPPGSGIADISLREAVPGSEAVVGVRDREDSTVYEIPIEVDVEPDSVSSVDVEDQRDALVSTPLFSELPPAALGGLIRSVRLVELDAGEILFAGGDAGTDMFVIAAGEVDVVTVGPPKLHIGTLGEGEFFGEIALITTQPRSATVIGKEDSILLAIDRDVIGALVGDNPEILRVMLRFVRDRLVANLTRSSAFFSPFAAGDRQRLVGRFRFLEADPGTVLIEEGHPADGLFIVLAGTVDVRGGGDGEERHLATLGCGEIAGEMSLLANDDAVATVTTTSKSLLLKLPATDFREIIMTHPRVLEYLSDVADSRNIPVIQFGEAGSEYPARRLDLV